jgi:4-diphosphocytidyl-2-C-methyl-D-erythritol kinase
VREAAAPAKINLALVVGPRRDDGKHEVVTVLQRVALGDRVSVAPAPGLDIVGFANDTIVRKSLETLAASAGVEPRWLTRIWKSIPVAAGLGGGSSDAATAMQLANELLPSPLPVDELAALAARIGADVPFFLRPGPQVGTGDGSSLAPLSLPQDFWVVLALPDHAVKRGTADVYRRFDEREGANGFAERRAALLEALAAVAAARDLDALPANDLASSPLAAELLEHGAFRADVSGAGPTVYGLFAHRRDAEAAARAFRTVGRTWVTTPC